MTNVSVWIRLLILYVLFLFAAVFLPGIGLLFYMALPLPILFFHTKRKTGHSFLFWLLAALLSFLLGGELGVWLAVLSGITGFTMGELYKRKTPAFGVWLGGTLSYLFNFLLLYGVSMLFWGYNPIQEAQQSVLLMLNEAGSITAQSGQGTSGQIDQIREQVQYFPSFMPTVFILLSVVFALVTHLLAKRWVQKGLGHPFSFPPFRLWTFPRSILLYYIVSLLLTLNEPDPGTLLFNGTVNLYTLLSFILMLQGLSFLFYWVWIKKKPRIIPVLVIIVIILTAGILPIPMEVVKFLGIIDLGFMMKKRLKP